MRKIQTRTFKGNGFNRDKLDKVAGALLEKEVISAEEFQELIK